jgi:hypothetical protein
LSGGVPRPIGRSGYISLPDCDRSCVPREIFDRLVDHERRFGRLSRLADDDRVTSGADLLEDNSWPFCGDCLLPLESMLNGHAGLGYWVSRIADGESLCGACWLAGHYGNDHDRMIDHVLRYDLPDRLMLAFARADAYRRRKPQDSIDALCRSYWRSPGLFELLRLHRVSMATAAAVVSRMAKALVAAVRADEIRIDRLARADGWRGGVAA